jgi:hypothetical protein
MNKSIQMILSLFTFICGLQSFGLEGHAKHGMLLFGETEIFASHIVYKVPHNFQVILKIRLDEKSKDAYLKERAQYPNDQIIFLLDSMDISRIKEKPQIVGEIFRRGEDEAKYPIGENVILNPSDYSMIYFDELPLDLRSPPTI